jgi:predicted nucleic acid-binding protein
VSFLLDTNVVSEWTKPRPNGGVITWLEEADEDRVFLSVATLAELRHGIERLAAGARRKKLDAWLREDLPLRFESRILPLTVEVADQWGRVIAHCEASGRPLAAMDGLIAATATVHGLTLVTRNTADFETALKSLLNPWDE